MEILQELSYDLITLDKRIDNLEQGYDKNCKFQNLFDIGLISERGEIGQFLVDIKYYIHFYRFRVVT